MVQPGFSPVSGLTPGRYRTWELGVEAHIYSPTTGSLRSGWATEQDKKNTNQRVQWRVFEQGHDSIETMGKEKINEAGRDGEEPQKMDPHWLVSSVRMEGRLSQLEESVCAEEKQVQESIEVVLLHFSRNNCTPLGFTPACKSPPSQASDWDPGVTVSGFSYRLCKTVCIKAWNREAFNLFSPTPQPCTPLCSTPLC